MSSGAGELRAALTSRSGQPAVVAITHPIVVAALAVAGTAYLGLVNPNSPGHYPPCPILLLTGHYCPGCGGLRALHALAHGDVPAAISDNLLVVLAAPILIALWIAWARRRRHEIQQKRQIPAWLGWSLLVGILAFWLLRNQPQLTFLTP